MKKNRYIVRLIIISYAMFCLEEIFLDDLWDIEKCDLEVPNSGEYGGDWELDNW